jgi:hypothetical protein
MPNGSLAEEAWLRVLGYRPHSRRDAPGSAPLLGGTAADHRLDGVEFADPTQRWLSWLRARADLENPG